MRRTKIICTIAPLRTMQPDRIQALVDSGMDCARLNFSHGELATHAEAARAIRLATSRAGRSVAILADLSGPKIRVGRFSGGPVELAHGASFTLTAREVDGGPDIVSVSYKALPREVKPGDAFCSTTVC